MTISKPRPILSANIQNFRQISWKISPKNNKNQETFLYNGFTKTGSHVAIHKVYSETYDRIWKYFLIFVLQNWNKFVSIYFLWGHIVQFHDQYFCLWCHPSKMMFCGRISHKLTWGTVVTLIFLYIF